MIIINKHKKTVYGERLFSGIQLVALARTRRHHFNIKHIADYLSRGFAEIVGDRHCE